MNINCFWVKADLLISRLIFYTVDFKFSAAAHSWSREPRVLGALLNIVVHWIRFPPELVMNEQTSLVQDSNALAECHFQSTPAVSHTAHIIKKRQRLVFIYIFPDTLISVSDWLGSQHPWLACTFMCSCQHFRKLSQISQCGALQALHRLNELD